MVEQTIQDIVEELNIYPDEIYTGLSVKGIIEKAFRIRDGK